MRSPASHSNIVHPGRRSCSLEPSPCYLSGAPDRCAAPDSGINVRKMCLPLSLMLGVCRRVFVGAKGFELKVGNDCGPPSALEEMRSGRRCLLNLSRLYPCTSQGPLPALTSHLFIIIRPLPASCPLLWANSLPICMLHVFRSH